MDDARRRPVGGPVPHPGDPEQVVLLGQGGDAEVAVPEQLAQADLVAAGVGRLDRRAPSPRGTPVVAGVRRSAISPPLNSGRPAAAACARSCGAAAELRNQSCASAMSKRSSTVEDVAEVRERQHVGVHVEGALEARGQRARRSSSGTRGRRAGAPGRTPAASRGRSVKRSTASPGQCRFTEAAARAASAT